MDAHTVILIDRNNPQMLWMNNENVKSMYYARGFNMNERFLYYCWQAEAARDEQEQGDYRTEPQKIECHQHRHDEVTSAEIYQDRDFENGRYYHE